jgi:hypothetical protein
VKGCSGLADAAPIRERPSVANTAQAAFARRTGAIGYVLVLVALFAFSFGTRAIGLGGAVTEDEDQWIARSGAFAHGLDAQEWRRTYLTGHPGVTTMWLTTVTLGVQRIRPFERMAGSPDVTTVPNFLPALERARVPFAVLQAGLVVLAAVLAGRLLGPAVGLVAGLLLAAEPFWAGVGPVVGMDGLLTGFLTVSLLALLLACQPDAPWPFGWAALAGLLFGLAFLSKTTALFAGPVVAALVLVVGWSAWTRRSAARRWWAMPFAIATAWALAASLVIWLLWPAAWLAPISTMIRAVTFSARLGGTPHAPGNFLLGQPVEDPGPLFYPVALLLRIGPGTLIGLLLLFVFGAPAPARRIIWPLLGYILLFVLFLTVALKKVDRYLLPILPTLGILAAIGWLEAAHRVRWRLARLGQRSYASGGARFVAPAPAVGLAALLALACQGWPLVQAGPFPLAAYNPLAGGVRMAERAIPVGWGDGLDVAGRRIRELAGGQPVVTSIWSPLRVSFGAHAPGPVVSDRQIAQADFYVDYVHARQRHLTPRQVQHRQPTAVVTIGGVDYARIYKLR